MKITRYLTTTALVGASLVAMPAFAQATAEQCAADPALEGCVAEETSASATQSNDAIIVTGSRIARPTNLDSTTPVIAISAADLMDTGDLSLGDELNRLPALRSTVSQANSTNSIGTAGINSLDLRGLGTARTLVLVNGRRHVTSSPGSYTVDTNTIPQALLERVDTVTGGTSAVYGSDAISGVVNFVLKRDFEGLELRAQAGVSSRGDRGSHMISGVFGKNFAEGRGNIAISAEYARQSTLLFEDREAQTGARTGVPGWYLVDRTIEGLNPNGTVINEPNSGDGIPDFAYIGINGGRYPGGTIIGGNRFGIISLGGMVQTVCPALTATNADRVGAVCTGQLSPTNARLSDNYAFMPDGTLVRDQPTTDMRNIGGARFGGLSATGIEGAMLLPGLERISTNILARYEVSPAFEPFIEAKYVRIVANQTSTQPTFVNGTLTPTFYLDNPFLTQQARDTIKLITGQTSDTGSFNFYRFNNDIGTRAEDHKRETYRIVGGFRGALSETGNLRYEVVFNYGRTETYYETGGNVDVAKFNAAANAVRDPVSGQIVCRVNADTNPDNDMPGCVPLNLFGENNASQAAKDYVLFTSSRNQWAEQHNAVAYIAGDSSGLFELPGGPVGFSVGAEYRREDAYSDYDDYTQSGRTFLNSISEFNPPAVKVYEGFAELRVPLIKESFIHELSLDGAARFSKYSTADKGVWAYNVGATFAPVRDIRFRAGYARSVRAPNLSDMYATPSQTFANNFVDPCSQGTPIKANENRERNCRDAGIPTTITLPDGSVVPWVNNPTSGILGVNQGNLNLQPEVGKSLTVGAIFEPSFVPGLALSVDFYKIKVKSVIAGLTGQQIVDRCYDDPVGLDNPFCSAVFRRSSTDPMVNGTLVGQGGRRFGGFPDFALGTVGIGFLNQPFNYAALKTSGIDADLSYRRKFGELSLSTRLLASYLIKREQFTFITDPTRSTRVHSTLGDPRWKAQASLNLAYRNFDFSYDLSYVGRQTIASWETMFSHQGRQPTNADAYPTAWYPDVWYHSFQVGAKINDNFRAYIGVDNAFDRLPPYGATGTGSGSAVWSVTGRYFYTGIKASF